MVRESRNRIARSASGLVVALLLLASGVGHAQVQVELSHRALSVGERLTYDIQIDYEDPDDVVVPEVAFPGFRLVEGPSVRPATRISVDQRSRVVEIRLGFEAVEPGRYVLDPVLIEVAGQVFQTPVKLVEVGRRGARDQVPFLARWVVPEDPLFVGESRAVSLEIYNADEFVYPSEIAVQAPAQAITEEVQGLGSIGQSVVDGVTLYEIPVAVFMVTPSAAGSIRMESAQVEWEGLTSTAPSVSMIVVDAPPAIAASGAVGRFSLSASVDGATISATETVVLTVRLDGAGNLHFLQLPEITVDGFRIESEERDERLTPVDIGYSGYIEDRLTLRPIGAGTGRVTIDQFAHFDRSLNRVVRTRIPVFEVQITPVKEPVTDEGPEFSFELLRSEEIRSVEPRNWYRNPMSYGLFVPGLLVLLVLRIWKRRGSQASLIALAAFVFVAAASDDLPWPEINRALELYDAGDLTGAIHAFEDTSRRAPGSPGIQHNLAVLYYQQGDIGRSVYAAREAVRLNPSSGRIRDTQLLIERAAGLERSVPARHIVHPDLVFGVLAGVVNVFCVLLVFLGRQKGLRRAGLLAIGQILLGVIAIALTIGLVMAAGVHEDQVGVVLEELSLRRIPSHAAESWLNLAAGTAVDLITQKDGFVLVRTDLGLEGWVNMDSILWPRNPAISVLRYRAFVM
ncbi:MAG: BatD family protein [Spirochaetales bacterium]|nr:BatD family protein [Spirochaetales bacterium]